MLTDSQRRLLDEARELAGGGALIPPGRNYAEHKKVYEDQTKAAGLDHMHGLRHAYALDRYEEITGWKAPAAGGPRRDLIEPPFHLENHRYQTVQAADWIAGLAGRRGACWKKPVTCRRTPSSARTSSPS